MLGVPEHPWIWGVQKRGKAWLLLIKAWLLLQTQLGLKSTIHLYITKNCVFCWYATADKWKLFESEVLIKSGYYIVPSPTTSKTFKDMNIWICRYSCRILPGSVLCTTSLELLSEKITSPLRKIRLKLFFAKKKKKYTHERTYCKKKTLKLFHASFILKAKFHDANQSRIFTEWHKQSCYLRCRVFRRSNKT